MFKNNKLLKISILVFILALYTSFLTYKMKIPAADDLPRQITIGGEVLKGNWDILYKNTFSYIEPEYTFYNHHWLSGVFFYVLYTSVGWGGLSIFKILILLSAFAIIFKVSAQKSNFWLVSLVSIPAIFILRERTGLRPEVFSYLFIALFVYLLFYFEKNPKTKKIFWLIPLQLLWVNMHVFFSIGIMLVGGFLFEKLIFNWGKLKQSVEVKRLMIVLVGVILVSFVNPRFIHGVFYRYPNISLKISENQSISMFLNHATQTQDISVYVFKPLVVILGLSILLFFYQYFRQKRKKRLENEKSSYISPIPIFYILAGVATAILSFFILRALSFFGFMFMLAVPALLHSSYIYLKDKFSVLPPRIVAIFKKIFVVLIFLVLGYFTLQSQKGVYNFSERGLGAASMSYGGINFFKENNLKGPIFNDADIGSYLIHYLYPQERVFSDNRFGDAYSKAFWDEVYIPTFVDERVWQENLARYQFNVIFLYQYDDGPGVRQFMYNRLQDPEWAFVYGDTFSIIFVRNTPENEDVIRKHHITPENGYEKINFLLTSGIEEDKIAAADILNLLWRVDLSRNVFLDVVLNRPDNPKIWMIMGEWELSIERLENSLLGMMYLEKAISLGQKTPEAYSFLGLAYFKLGRFDEAIEATKKALKINPDREDAKDLLLEIGRVKKLRGQE